MSSCTTEQGRRKNRCSRSRQPAPRRRSPGPSATAR